MSVITVFAVLVMIAVNLKGRSIDQDGGSDPFESKAAIVMTLNVEPETVEIQEKYSGILRPFERFELSFKTAGRVASLGKNRQGNPLDVGDSVSSGQTLAILDTALLEANKKEIEAVIEFAQTEFERANDLRQNEGAISESEYAQKKRELAVAQARLASLQTQIDDATLIAPIDGVISIRHIKPGEAVSLGRVVFEIIQVEKIKLVLGVPESRIPRMIGTDVDSQKLFAYVNLIGQQRLEQNSPPLRASFLRVGETSDDKSGLFEVEFVLDNVSGKLRPGMIAVAEVVVDEVTGFKIPVDACFMREGQTSFFVVKDVNAFEVAGESDIDPNTGIKAIPPPFQAAKRVYLKPGSYEFQGEYVIARELAKEDRRVIVSGHRRLVDGRMIETTSPTENK